MKLGFGLSLANRRLLSSGGAAPGLDPVFADAWGLWRGSDQPASDIWTDTVNGREITLGGAYSAAADHIDFTSGGFGQMLDGGPAWVPQTSGLTVLSVIEMAAYGGGFQALYSDAPAVNTGGCYLFIVPAVSGGRFYAYSDSSAGGSGGNTALALGSKIAFAGLVTPGGGFLSWAPTPGYSGGGSVAPPSTHDAVPMIANSSDGRSMPWPHKLHALAIWERQLSTVELETASTALGGA